MRPALGNSLVSNEREMKGDTLRQIGIHIIK